MKKIFYERVGRRYRPVAEYNSEWIDSYRQGTHLVVCRPGLTSRIYNVDPNYAALIAAGRVAQDVMASALIRFGKIRMQRPAQDRQLTPGQAAAWENLVKEFGDSARQLEWPSAQEVAEEATKAMIDEAKKLMYNPSVRQAYEHFELMCKLAKDHNHD